MPGGPTGSWKEETGAPALGFRSLTMGVLDFVAMIATEAWWWKKGGVQWEETGGRGKGERCGQQRTGLKKDR